MCCSSRYEVAANERALAATQLQLQQAARAVTGTKEDMAMVSTLLKTRESELSHARLEASRTSERRDHIAAQLDEATSEAQQLQGELEVQREARERVFAALATATAAVEACKLQTREANVDIEASTCACLSCMAER